MFVCRNCTQLREIKITKGWIQTNGNWYFYDESGNMATGWQKIGNYWYYFDKTTGVMATSKWVDGVYYVDENGRMATNQWVDGGKYYVGADGKYIKGYKG